MGAERRTFSLTPELAQALDRLAQRRGESRSATVETLLREHELVGREVRGMRGALGLKNDRSVEKLLAIGDASRAALERREREGKVRFLD